MNNKSLQTQNFHILVIDDDQKLRLLLKQFLENNGFKLNSITLEPDAIYVSAILDIKTNVLKNTIKPFTSYSRLLEERLNKFSETIEIYNNIIIHGATNKLNNILGWLDDDFG